MADAAPTRRAIAAALALLSIAVPIVAAEAFLELTSRPETPAPEPERFLRLREQPRNAVQRDVPTDAYLTGTDLEKREYTTRTDSEGFIEPSRIHANPDLEIFFLGGSTTECKFLPEADRFPVLVGRMLEDELGLAVNSYNGGVSGNHSMHSNLALLGKIVDREPEVVVLMENINDLTVLLYTGSYWNDHASRSLIVAPPAAGRTTMAPIRGVKDFFRASLPQLYGRLASLRRSLEAPEDEWSDVRGRHIEYDEEEIVSAFQRSLRTFAGVARAHGIEPVLMTQANRFVEEPDLRQSEAWEGFLKPWWERLFEGTGLDYARYQKLYARFNEAIREVAREEGVLLIDLAREVPQDSEHMYDFVHYTSQGSALAARHIVSGLRPLLEGRPKTSPKDVAYSRGSIRKK